jgi:hypothetical protein
MVTDNLSGKCGRCGLPFETGEEYAVSYMGYPNRYAHLLHVCNWRLLAENMELKQKILGIHVENDRLKELWFSDANPEETEYVSEYMIHTRGEEEL